MGCRVRRRPKNKKTKVVFHTLDNVEYDLYFSLIALLSLFLFFVLFTEYRLKMGYPLFERIAGELPHRRFIESKAFLSISPR